MEGQMTQDNKDTLALSAFIRETLVEIVRGVEQARRALEGVETNAEICPTGLHFAKGQAPAPFKPGRGFVQEVEFDVAITVNKVQSREGAGEASLKIGVPQLAWLGGAALMGDQRAKRQQERGKISRVTFRVPVLLPSEAYPWDEGQQEETAE
jgi:hypothetical protein